VERGAGAHSAKPRALTSFLQDPETGAVARSADGWIPSAGWLNRDCFVTTLEECNHARLRLSARVAIAASARRASLTDFESGNTSANSGSMSTTLIPRRYLSTYLPRTPPEKSYSALISGVRRLEGGFFIIASLMLGCGASADQPDPLSSNSMNHN